MLEKGHDQFSQRTVNRLAKSQPGVVRLGNGAPAIVVAIDGNDVIVIPDGFEIQNKRWTSIHAQRGRRKQSAIEAMPGFIPDHPSRRAAGFSIALFVVRQVVEIVLDAMRSG